jgi:methylmalonyl-CoA mutase N-terminal domain/subunit
LSENTLVLFKEIENEGGFMKAIEKNIIQNKIKQVKPNVKSTGA